MKSAILAIVGAALVAAQDIASLPACGQQCATAMLSAEKAEELGCSPGDTQCLCTNPNFMFGFRDCSNPNCPIDEALQIVAFGVQLCSDEGIVITDGGSSQITGTDGGSVSTVYSTLTSDGEAVTTAVDTTTLGGAGGSVSTVYSTLTSDGEAVTTAVATTTLGGAEGSQSGSATDATGSSSDGGAPVLVSTLTTDGTVITTTFSTVTSAPDPSGPATNSLSASTSGGSSDDGGDSTTTDGASETSAGGEGGDGGEGGGDATSTDAGDAAMPQRTAAPGLLAAAGLVALLL